MIYALWYGGANYAGSDLQRDLEVFETITDARAAMSNRYRVGHIWTQHFDYADGRTEDVLTPTVTEYTEMHIWLADPRETRPYPDFRIELDDTDTFQLVPG